jgi:DNA invertase Pin-like site-specific DNA recombinase
MHAIIYAAKSTDDKRGSIPTQIEDCRAMAEREQWTVVATYEDESKSAYSGSRGKGLAQAREHTERLAAEDGESVLVVQHTDRLARGDAIQAAHLVEVVLWAMKANVRVRSVQDDRTGESILDAALIGTRNYEDSRRKSESIKSSKRCEFEAGNWQGGDAPDGFVSPDGSKGLVEDPERAPVVRRVFELADKGLGRPAIKRALNAEGLRTRPIPSGKFKHDGLPWTTFRVADVLSNPVYTGRVVWHRRRSDEEVRGGNHEPLIDPELFDRVNAKLTFRKNKPAQGRPTERYALSHLAVCSSCGRPMRGETDSHVRKDGTQKRSYVCASVRESDGLCDVPRVDALRIDAAIIEHLAGEFIDFEKWAKEQADATAQGRAVIEGELAHRKKALTKAQRGRDRVSKAYREKVTPAREHALEDALTEVSTAEAAVDEVELQLAAVSGDTPTDAMLDVYNSLLATLDDDRAPLNERLLRLFKEVRIAVHDEAIGVLPVLREDMIEVHGGAVLRTVGHATEVELSNMSDKNIRMGESPVLLLVPPPSSEIVLSNMDNSAYAQFGDVTFHEDLFARRMAAAAELLVEQPAIPVRDVARFVGYRQAPHFARAFRRCYGLSPARFRHQARTHRAQSRAVAGGLDRAGQRARAADSLARPPGG